MFYKLLSRLMSFDETENALTHQACTLRGNLEKALQDNVLLFQKIGI